MLKLAVIPFIFLTLTSTYPAKAIYPISRGTYQEIIQLEEELNQHTNGLVGLAKSDPASEQSRQFISLSKNVSAIYIELRYLGDMIIMEAFHGRDNQRNKGAIWVIKQDIASFSKSLDRAIRYNATCVELHKDPVLVKQFGNSTEYFQKVKKLLDRISQELPYKNLKPPKEFEEG